VEQRLLFNTFFRFDGAQMAIFGDFLRPVFLASHVQHISDMHSKFARRKKKKKKEEETTGRNENIMFASATHGGHNYAAW